MRITFLLIPLFFIWYSSYPQNLEDSLMNLAKRTNNSNEKIDALNKLSSILRYKQPAISENYALQAETLSHQLNYFIGEIAACYNLGVLNDLKGNYPQGESYYLKGIEIINHNSSDTLQKKIPTLYQGLANNYMGKGDFKNSLLYFRKIYQLASIDSELKINVFSGIANIYNYTGQHDSSIFYYQKSLKLGTELKDTNSIANSLNNLGALFSRRNQLQEALKYYQRANYFYELEKDYFGLCSSNKNLGKVYSDLGKNEKAKEYYLIALHYALTYDYKSQLGGIYVSLGDYYSKVGKNQESLQSFKSAHEIFVQIKDSYGIATSALNIGTTLFDLGNYKEAISYLNNIESLIREIDMNELSMEYYKARSEINSKLFKYESAYEDHRFYSNFKDSIFNNDMEQAIQDAEAKYKITERTLLDSLKSSEEKKVLAAETRKQIILRDVFIGGFAIVLIFAGVFFKQRNETKKEKLKSEAEKKKSETLLLNILPFEVAEELKTSGSAKAKAYTMVTVMFTDFKDFTLVSEKISAELLVAEIHYCFSAFDNIIQKYKIEKIKTIGDSYLCASGLPITNFTHAVDMVKASLEIRDFMTSYKKEKETKGEAAFELRIGIHTGPVVAGVVGIKKFVYDIWGDTVNIAARFEQKSEAGKINISGTTYELVKTAFNCTYRGKLAVKNKGELDMYFVNNKLYMS